MLAPVVAVLVSQSLLAWIRTVGSLSLLLIPLLVSTPPFRPLRRLFSSFFSDFVTLDSVLPPEPPTTEQQEKAREYRIRVWRQAVLAGLAVLELGTWMAVLAAELLQVTSREKDYTGVVFPTGMLFVWLYLCLLPVIRPPSTPPWPALAVYLLLWVLSIVNLCLAWYDRASTGYYPEWADTTRILLEFGNIAITTCLVVVVSGLRLASPETLSRLPAVGRDDIVTLSSWMTFSWINPFIKFGNSQELNPADLPLLSMTQQSEIVFDRFRQIRTKSLLHRLFLANKLDLCLDASFCLLSVIFNYAGPFFLKRILDGLAIRTPEAISRAYLYALLSLLASILKAGSDLLHLYHGRRAVVRVKAELTAAIYDKALRRKDASGVIASKEDSVMESKDGKGANKDGKAGTKDHKADKEKQKTVNADSGKVVNLMAGDTNRLGNTVAGAYFIYGSPFEIVVASIFLYNILGWSAFAGVIVLAFAVPANSYVSKRSIRITQDLLKARDKRISVMNELIGAIQFIKFFAWIEQWKGRAADARAKEMKQMARSIINSLFFGLLWNIAPIAVTLFSFFCYIVIEKRDLTVSVAFTSISLFSMLQLPLNVIPTYVVIILQAHVSCKRIEDFLNEDEVSDWVSSLKRVPSPSPSGPTKIGFQNATLCWNSTKRNDSVTKMKIDPEQLPAPSSPTSTDGTTAVNTPEPVVFNLINLNIDFPIGKLTVVTGPTGSGKTGILTALLGEMELLEGNSWLPKETTQVDPQTKLRNSIAYGAQTPWLQQKSIKDNILFGEEYEEDRYEATLDACALLPDLDVLEDGDATEIGAKGVSLSGGQKARVALARAVYSFTQHVLLDDPLAAVDSHTAKHLKDKCLDGPLLKGRTVILVSHHVELLLPSADYIVRMLDGRVDAQGTPDQLRSSGDLDGLVVVEEAEVSKDEPITNKEAADDDVQAVDNDSEKLAVKKKGPGKKLVQDEERSVGNVKWETYKLYILAATRITWVFSFTVLLISQFFTVGERYWLKLWGEAYTTQVQSVYTLIRPAISDQHQSQYYADAHQHVLHHTGNASEAFATDVASLRLPSADAHPGFYLTIYAAITFSDALLGIASSAIGGWGQYRAAVNLHNRLLDVVMRATVRFFSVTPVGRIINRFARDIETIDSSLSQGLRTVIVYLANLVVAVGVVAVIVPWFLVPAALIMLLYYQYSILYLRVGRSLRRLESSSRSPIFSGFAEVLDGVVSVRAFSVEAKFMKTLCEQVDQTHSAFYYYWMMNRWLLLRFDVLGAFSVAFTALLALSGAVQPGSAGMAILSAQGFVSACYWVSRFWGSLEMDFNAVERVQEYLNVPQEPPATITDRRPPAYWPSSNSGDSFLSVRDLDIKYAPDLPSVFQGSFDVKAGEKIGLIGRTGSGKSTLAMSMLRFTDPASGTIWLDGIDITTIGVDDLRSRITYIPQDAVLFSGTVRENLDPFSEHSDEDLRDALARVNLGPRDTLEADVPPSRAVSSHRLAAIAAEDSSGRPASLAGSGAGTPGTKTTISLTTEVSAGGSNFSQGQRQLVAMARALLRRSNLIIMDEATASVDFATDEAIQKAIRIEFKSSTLLTIAHRLSSVIDYDRLLVLSDGKVAEFDTPINLLRRDDSLFRNLCEKSGKYRELFRAAERKEKGEA